MARSASGTFSGEPLFSFRPGTLHSRANRSICAHVIWSTGLVRVPCSTTNSRIRAAIPSIARSRAAHSGTSSQGMAACGCFGTILLGLPSLPDRAFQSVGLRAFSARPDIPTGRLEYHRQPDLKTLGDRGLRAPDRGQHGEDVAHPDITGRLVADHREGIV